MTCPRCGEEAKPGARFCASCGYALESPETQSRPRVAHVAVCAALALLAVLVLASWLDQRSAVHSAQRQAVSVQDL